VREQVGEKLPIGFADRGEHTVKNITRPVHVYRIDKRGEVRTTAENDPATGLLSLPDRPSIAVLPFQNMSGDAEQDYFVDGMVEDIITGLSRIKWLFVIARNSSFAYKGKSPDIRQVGRELGVRYVLEGSVRKAADRVRITGQLVEAESGRHFWAERYDRAMDDVFALQDARSRSMWSARSSRACARPRSSASGASGPRIWTPTTSCCAPLRSPLPRCPKARRRRCRCRLGRRRGPHGHGGWLLADSLRVFRPARTGIRGT